MSTTPARNRLERSLSLALFVLLGAAAGVYLGYHLVIALEADDTNHLETPLALAVARQLQDGPATLYGPFSGAMPLVLIHAPLYYRLAGLVAWPLAAAGFGPLTSAFAAGRVLSLVGLLATLAAAYRLARLDGTTARAGLWAGLLIAASPVIGSFPVTVRPDMAGVCLQTLGVWLVWTGLREASPRFRTLAGAYVAFGLACCVKQHDVVAALVSSVFLAVACMRGRVRRAQLVGAHLAGLAVVLAYYAAEQVLTSGQLVQSVFLLPAEFGRVNRSSWSYTGKVFWEVAKMSVGLLALAAACLVATRRRGLRWGLDAVLGVYLAAELIVMWLLCLNSSGAWTNYAMQAVVLAAILIGRALNRIVALPPAAWRIAPVPLAALVLLLADARLVAISASNRSADRMALEAMFADPRVGVRTHEELYFVGAPQNNRRYGRIDLAHDEWLYTSYEALAAAEPRSRWLQSALTEGSVRQVIVCGESLAIRGLSRPLPLLGYRLIARFGRYVVWERRENHRQRAVGTARTDAKPRSPEPASTGNPADSPKPGEPGNRATSASATRARS